MNINEFERNKPRKTRAAILKLKSYITDCVQENTKNRTYDARLQTMSEMIDAIETLFLAGE